MPTVGSDGLLVHVQNGVWTRASSPTDQTLRSVVMLSSTQGWAVGWRPGDYFALPQQSLESVSRPVPCLSPG